MEAVKQYTTGYGTKIHWGGPGTYKTSGAIQDDVIPAILEGRPIVTNIRGFELEKIYEEYPEAPQIELIWLDDTEQTDRDKIARWWHWAPHGALLIFDEAQDLFRKAWKDSDLKSFEYPGGVEAAKEDNRPLDWGQAWDKQRHFNYKIILTTTNIRKIRDDIRQVAAAAYAHKGLPFGFYLETVHSAADNKPIGKCPQKPKRITKKTFALYSSTATGIIQTDGVSQNVFKDLRVIIGLLFVVVAFAYGEYNTQKLERAKERRKADKAIIEDSGPVKARPADNSYSVVPVASNQMDIGPNGGGIRSLPSVDSSFVGDIPGFGVSDDHPLHDALLYISGYVASSRVKKYYVNAERDGQTLTLSADQLVNAGYTISGRGPCDLKLRWGGRVYEVGCGAPAFFQKKRERLSVGFN